MGDVDGDGLDDLVLSDTTLDPDEMNLYLLPGSLVGLAIASELAQGTLDLLGGATDYNGTFAVGDLDEDGTIDLAVGNDDLNGEITFLLSAAIGYGGALGTPYATVWFDDTFSGSSVEKIFAAAGDVTGDGRNDLAIAAHWVDEGVVYLFAGPLEGAYAESDAHAIVRGTDPDRNIGYSLGHADTTGDGVADLLVTASSYEDGYVVHGPLSGDLDVDLVFDAHIAVPVNEFLLGLDHGGDLDGDGAPELLSQPWVLPSDLDREVDATLAAVGQVEAAEDHLFVDSLKPAGDVDGDGFDDLLATTTGYLAMTDDRAHLLYGPIEGVVCTGATGVTFDIDADPWSISGAGDTNGDGYDDVVIGSVSADGLEPGAGAAYVFLGGP